MFGLFAISLGKILDFSRGIYFGFTGEFFVKVNGQISIMRNF